MQQFKPTFDQIQSLVKAGSKDEAQKVLDNLSDSDYQLYKDTLAVEKRGATSKGEAQFLPTYRQIQSLVNAGKSDEAQQTLDGLSDQEYKYYQLMKKKGL